MSTPALALQAIERSLPVSLARPRRIDILVVAGVAIAIGAVIAGIASTGISLRYFLQPAGALIVLGGTIGVTLITTSRNALRHSFQRVAELFAISEAGHAALIEEIVGYSRAARAKGLFALEPLIAGTRHRFFAESLRLAVDVRNRAELHAALETKLRLRERQGETDAKTLEVAGGFAPAIGVLGTVIGLIQVLRQFSDIASVAAGTGTAFVSTIYGLALANLILLPAAHRVRASVAELFETHELIMEGTLCLFDGLHPALVEERLSSYLRPKRATE